jgi:hypothetical protein
MLYLMLKTAPLPSNKSGRKVKKKQKLLSLATQQNVKTKWQESFTSIEEKIQSAAVTSGRGKNCRTVKEVEKIPNSRGD